MSFSNLPVTNYKNLKEVIYMTAIFKMGMIKSSKDKGLYFWTFILPIIFIVLFISIFTSVTMADNKEEVINKIVPRYTRSEEHTSEHQSRCDIVVRLWLREKQETDTN